jgi:hypothetical protein
METRVAVADYFLALDPSVADIGDVLHDAVTGADPAIKDAVRKAFQAVHARLVDDKRPIMTNQQALANVFQLAGEPVPTF